jgi:hypothetical protein
MEAKLVSMAQFKPQDADYIPGSSAFPLNPLGSARASSGASVSVGSASPGRTYESPRRGVGSPDRYYVPSPRSRLGTDSLDLDAHSQVGTPLSVTNVENASDMPADGVEVPPAAKSSTTTEETPSSSASMFMSKAGLPAKPPAAPIPPTPAEIRQVARDQTFKKGLAGLPKRPVFK